MKTSDLRTTRLEDLKDITVSDQVHGDRLCTALLHRRRDGTKDRTRGLTGLVPALDLPVGQRIDDLRRLSGYTKGSSETLVPSPGQS